MHDSIRLRQLTVLRSIDKCQRPRCRFSSTSLQDQSATESLRASSSAAHARATWGHSREIGTHPKVYIRNPLLLYARKQPDTLETDRPLWTPMLPQRDCPKTDDRLWTARYSIGQSFAKMMFQRTSDNSGNKIYILLMMKLCFKHANTLAFSTKIAYRLTCPIYMTRHYANDICEEINANRRCDDFVNTWKERKIRVARIKVHKSLAWVPMSRATECAWHFTEKRKAVRFTNSYII